MGTRRRTRRWSLRHLREVLHHRLVVPRLRRQLPDAVRGRDAARVARILVRATRLRAGHAAPRPDRQGGEADEAVVDVVLLAKSGLTADLDAAFADDAGVRVRLLEREWIKIIAAEFLSSGVSDYRYARLRDENDLRRLMYRSFLVEVMRRYLPAVGATTMVSGNFVYWAERELGPALREIGARFVVLHKEALLAAWPLTAQAFRRAVSAGVGAFEGDVIGVYSTDMARLLIDAGVITEDRVTVIGAPRIDLCHAHRRAGRPGSSRARVTLFTFPTWRGLTFPPDPQPPALPPGLEQGWARLLGDTVDAMVELASRRPDLEVIAKVKAGGEDDEATARLREAAERSRLSGAGNLRLVVAGEGGELVLASEVIVAFNSTVILEAIAAGTYVVVPEFGEATLPGATGGMLDLGGTVTRAPDPAALITAVLLLVDARPAGDAVGRDLDAEARVVLERFVGNPDGHASERLRRLVVGGTA